MFNVTCELSQPMDKTDFSSTAKIRQNPSHKSEIFWEIPSLLKTVRNYCYAVAASRET